IWRLSTSIRAYTADPRPKSTCSNTSALAHPRFTKWCSHSNAGDSSEDSQEQPAALNCSLIPNCCPNYFECRFNQSKPLCRGTSGIRDIQIWMCTQMLVNV